MIKDIGIAVAIWVVAIAILYITGTLDEVVSWLCRNTVIIPSVEMIKILG